MTKDIMLFVLFLAVLLLCAWPLGNCLLYTSDAADE